MIGMRLAGAVLTAATLAGCLTYFVTSQPPQIEAEQRSAPVEPVVAGTAASTPAIIDQHLAAEQQAAAAFERAAKTILKRLPDAMAYAGADEPPITGHIPLPKRRPIPR
jgi:hypothetical protein